MLAESDGANVVLSVIAKEPSNTRTGDEWIAASIARARKEGQPLYLGKGFADTKPQPPSVSLDSPSDLIPAGGSTKPARKLLSIKSAVKKQYDQTFADGPRGRIVFTEGKSVIELFEARDLSTFLHETGHLWLEELRADAMTADAPDQLRADWQAVQDWFAANGNPVVDGVIPVDAHEMWARGVFNDLNEGRLPEILLPARLEKPRMTTSSIFC